MNFELQSLIAAEQQVNSYRELAEQDPATHLPHLAMSLNNLANKLHDLEEWPSALAASEEAVELCRELADRNVEDFRPRLAMSLGMLGQILAASGQAKAAQVAFREGLELMTPHFLATPDRWSSIVAALLSDYLRLADELGETPPDELLGPIIATMQSLQGSAEESNDEEAAG